MVKPGPKPRSLADRLAERVARGAPDECWPCSGYRDSGGYGRMNVDGRPQLLHRLVYEQEVGPIPEGLVVMHRCDTPPCCNPAHLRLGTHAENQADMTAKRRGRGPNTRGQAHHSARLTDDDVATMRAEYAAGGVTQRGLAKAYGVTQAQVWNILQNRQRTVQEARHG